MFRMPLGTSKVLFLLAFGYQTNRLSALLYSTPSITASEGCLGETLIVVRFAQDSHGLAPRSVILSGNIIEVRRLQLKNALSPILVRLSGRVIEVRLSHKENASSPILVILSGRVIVFRWLQSLNA